MNVKQNFLSLLFLVISLFCAAQQSYDEGVGAFDPGENSITLGSTKDNSYSALLINGPLLPLWEESTRDIVFKFKSAGKNIIRSYKGGSWDTYLQFLTTPTTGGKPLVRLHIDQCGYIGIGTTAPTSLLSVNGHIRAKGVFVSLDNWADFVFDDNYELLSLEELDSHIQEEKHLPGIPSAKEVEEEGISLGDMNAKLLQKIEELTLYTIQQQKMINELIKKVDQLETIKN